MGKHYFLKRLLFLCFFGSLMLTFSFVKAQQVAIEGIVTSIEDGIGLPGVNVVVKGTTTGTITDFEGKYKLSAKSSDTIVYSYIGYVMVEEGVGARSTINIALSPDLESLSEVVVIGYGTVKKSHLTASVSKVKNDQLDQIPVARADEALIGKMSGVQISTTDARVGESSTIKIRGTSSLTTDSDPLLVIDGVPVSGEFFSTINMNDVESIEVLKDAASCAIYGSRGAAGVIMITMKQGKSGQTKFSFNSYYGAKSAVVKEGVMPSLDEWIAEVGSSVESDYAKQLGTETDWYDLMVDGGTIQSYSLSATGGNEKTTFSFSGGYLKDEGILLSDEFEKFNARVNINTRLNDHIKMGMNIAPSYGKTRRFPLRFHDATRSAPWLGIYHTEQTLALTNDDRPDLVAGDYMWEEDYDEMPNSSEEIRTSGDPNPYQRVTEKNFQRINFNLLSNAFIGINIAKGLDFRSSLAIEYRTFENEERWGVNSHKKPSDAKTVTAYDRTSHWVNENYFTYNNTFGQNDLNTVLGFSAEKNNAYLTDLAANGYDFDYIPTISESNEVYIGTTEKWNSTLASVFGRINYAYANKYLASVSLRRDGSSRFGYNTKYGIFPAFSAGWRLGQEDFMSGIEAISELKLRASYGTNGNDAASAYSHLGLVNAVSPVLNGQTVSGFSASKIANPDLKWQKSVEFSPGLDLGLFKNRIFLLAEYYIKTSEDLLTDLPVSAITGFTTAYVNLGVIENKGIDIELTTNNISSTDFSWKTTSNFSKNTNTIVDFAGADSTIFVIDPKRSFNFIAMEGQAASTFWGFEVDHEIPADQLNNTTYPINTASKEVYVKDQNGDGEITDEDKVVLGNPHPDFTWALTNTLRYKGFDLSFTFQGSHGADVVWMDKQYYETQWKGSTNDLFPEEDKSKIKQRIYTDDIVQDASYISLRNLNLGYTLPNTLTQKAGISNLRFYVAASNALFLMLGDYQGYNPEGTNEAYDPSTGKAGTNTNPLTYGYQRGAQPLAKSFTFGINLNF